MLSKVAYELDVLRAVAQLFGVRKAIEFALLLPLLLFGGRNRRVYERIAPCEMNLEGRRVILPHPDARFLHEIVIEGCYTTKAGFRIKEDDTIVDLGANVGAFTLMAAIRARKGRIIALEPEEENLRFLQANIAANYLTNIESHRMAISNQNGLGNLLVTTPGANTLLGDAIRKTVGRVQTVETITMRRLIERFEIRQIDFLKVDVEGAEFRMFEDFDWLEKVRRIAMEVHGNRLRLGRIQSVLESKNFEVSTMPVLGGLDKGMFYLYGSRKN